MSTFTKINLSRPVAILSGILLLLVASVATYGAPATEPDAALHRLLLFKFKAEATSAQISEVKQTFCRLQTEVPGMISAVWARDEKFSCENQFTYAVILSFACEEAVAEYEQHPDHQALTKIAPPIIENFFEMNYRTAPDATQVASNR